MGFQGQKAEQVKAIANQLSRLGNRSTDCPCPVEGCQKHTLSSSSLLFPVEVHPFPVNLRLWFDRGPVEATTTYQSIKCPTASDPVDPQLDRSRVPFVVFDSRA